MQKMNIKRGKEMNLNRSVLVLILTMICWCSSAKSFYFKEVQTVDSCFNQLLSNIEQICAKFVCDTKYHYVSTKIVGSDTIIEVHSYDFPGMYDCILHCNVLGVCKMSNSSFFIDQSLSTLFQESGRIIREKFSKKQIKAINQFSFNDCYIYWVFKNNECGIDLDSPWNSEIYKTWYDLELNTDCFCNYKKLSIDIIEEQAEP